MTDYYSDEREYALRRRASDLRSVILSAANQIGVAESALRGCDRFSGIWHRHTMPDAMRAEMYDAEVRRLDTAACDAVAAVTRLVGYLSALRIDGEPVVRLDAHATEALLAELVARCGKGGDPRLLVVRWSVPGAYTLDHNLTLDLPAGSVMVVFTPPEESA